MALPSYSASVITAVAKSQQNFTLPSFILGGRNASTYTLDKITTSYTYSVWRSEMFRIGKPFDVMRIVFSVFPGVATNQTIIPVLYFDNAVSNSIGTTINTTNYTAAKTEITLGPKNFASGVRGSQNFFLEFQISGSALAVIGLPIFIDVDEYDV